MNEMVQDYKDDEEQQKLSPEFDAMYIKDCECLMGLSCLKQMRKNIGSSRLCDLAHAPLRGHYLWKQKTNSRILNLNWKSKKVCKIINPLALLNGLFMINYIC